MNAKAEDLQQPLFQSVNETPHPYRWTVQEFHRLADNGLFNEDDRVELIEGEIIKMAPIGSGHAGRVKRLNHTLTVMLDGKAVISVQDPVVLGDYSEPQPDIAVLRWRDDFYIHANPQAEDILLIIEVADSTVRYDRTTKLPVYARYGIPEVWIVNLPQHRIEVYRELVDGEYGETIHHRSGRISPQSLPEAVIDVAGLFAE
jgi:Uma2 family endonuclease